MRAARAVKAAWAKIGEATIEDRRLASREAEKAWVAAHPLAKSEAQKAVNRFAGRGVIRPEKVGHLTAAGHESLTIKDALPRIRAVGVWAADNSAAIVGATYVAMARRGAVAVKVGSKWQTLADYAHSLGILRADINALTAPKSWAAAVKAAAKLSMWLGVPATGEAKEAKAALIAAQK